VGITVKCAGLMTVTPKAPPAEQQKALGSKPLISDEEMQEQYRQLFSDAKVERAAIEQHANKVRLSLDHVLTFLATLGAATSESQTGASNLSIRSGPNMVYPP